MSTPLCMACGHKAISASRREMGQRHRMDNESIKYQHVYKF